MSKVTKYRVEYSSWSEPKVASTARFSNFEDAFEFSRRQLSAEVSDRTGLIGQFFQGKLTEEFVSPTK
jgi:hypothetical protein